MDNLDHCNEIMQCIGRLYNDCDLQYNTIEADLDTILDNTKRIKAELLDLWSKSNDSIKHAYWVADTWCSNCNRFPVDCSLPISNRELTKYFEYCPHCGAKIRRCI